jgi:hypothetical protein
LLKCIDSGVSVNLRGLFLCFILFFLLMCGH